MSSTPSLSLIPDVYAHHIPASVAPLRRYSAYRQNGTEKLRFDELRGELQRAVRPILLRLPGHQADWAGRAGHGARRVYRPLPLRPEGTSPIPACVRLSASAGANITSPCLAHLYARYGRWRVATKAHKRGARGWLSQCSVWSDSRLDWTR